MSWIPDRGDLSNLSDEELFYIMNKRTLNRLNQPWMDRCLAAWCAYEHTMFHYPACACRLRLLQWEFVKFSLVDTDFPLYRLHGKLAVHRVGYPIMCANAAPVFIDLQGLHVWLDELHRDGAKIRMINMKRAPMPRRRKKLEVVDDD